MSDLVTALGLVLVIEGLIYAVNPSALKQMMALIHEIPDATLRIAGIGAIVLGFVIVWITRSGMV